MEGLRHEKTLTKQVANITFAIFSEKQSVTPLAYPTKDVSFLGS